jgi:hypothetical protein
MGRSQYFEDQRVQIAAGQVSIGGTFDLILVRNK